MPVRVRFPAARPSEEEPPPELHEVFGEGVQSWRDLGRRRARRKRKKTKRAERAGGTFK